MSKPCLVYIELKTSKLHVIINIFRNMQSAHMFMGIGYNYMGEL